MIDLSHLKVLVTGGGGTGVGIGACAILHACGAQLIINDITQIKAETAARKYPNAIPIQANISNPQEVKKMFEIIKSEVGVINALVNNAGVGLSKPIHEIKPEEHDKVFEVNLKGTWLVTKHFVKQLLDAKSNGNIVNVSSVHAHSSQPNFSIYAATKSAIEGFTRATAYELGKYKIRCNAIAPGMVHAEQNYDLIKTWASDPDQWIEDFSKNQQVLDHSVTPEDCGFTIAFLLSELSRSITGQTIYVDAGKTIMLFNYNYIR